jgi:2-keto-4-pentenoate hydratase
MDRNELIEAAARQLRDYDARTPGTIFADAFSLDVDGAYAVQTEVCRLREQRGERLIGYKVGCTSAAVRRQLGIEQPVFGRLFEGDSWASGIDFASTQFANPAIEGELAVRLSRDLHHDHFDEEVFDSVEAVFPVIEMHNLVFRRDGPSAEELIANNAVHAGFVYPTDSPVAAVRETDELRIEIDGVMAAVVSGTELLRTVVESLNWLRRELHEHGLELSRGQMILCGSVAEVFPVVLGSRISVVAGGLGSAHCAIRSELPIVTGVR